MAQNGYGYPNQPQQAAANKPQRSMGFIIPDFDISLYYHCINGVQVMGKDKEGNPKEYTIVNFYKKTGGFGDSPRTENYFNFAIPTSVKTTETISKQKPGTMVRLKGRFIPYHDKMKNLANMDIQPVEVLAYDSFFMDMDLGKIVPQNVYGPKTGAAPQQPQPPVQGYAPVQQQAPQAWNASAAPVQQANPAYQQSNYQPAIQTPQQPQAPSSGFNCTIDYNPGAEEVPF